MEELEIIDAPLTASAGEFVNMIARFGFSTIVMWFIIHFLYFRKSRRRDYYFTFSIVSISIFFLIFLLSSVKLKIGFALGLFAIFGIIRYRTESMPVREMTYLFAIIALSVINALAVTLSYWQLLIVNILFIVCIWVCESNRWLEHVSSRLVLYDRLELIRPDKRAELKADLEARTGLEILRVEVGHIDFLRDTAMIKVFFRPMDSEVGTIENVLKFPKPTE